MLNYRFFQFGYIHTHIRFTTLWTLPGITRVSRYQKSKTNLDFTSMVSGNGIIWTICKSAFCPRQMTMPAPHH